MRLLLGRLSALTLLVVALVAGSSAPTAAAQAGCGAQEAALESVRAQILAHNARPHVFYLPAQAAQFHAYNAEAAQLNAAQATATGDLRACEQEQRRLRQRQRALDELADRQPGSPTPKPCPADVRQALENAKAKLPPNWTPPPRRPGDPHRVPLGSPSRPFYDILRRDNPERNLGDVTLRGQPRPKVGDPDPARPGRSVAAKTGKTVKGQPDVSADHIVPLAEIINLPGFLRLTPENMWAVVRAPVNLQWLTQTANKAKGSKYVADMAQADPAWRAAQAALQDRVRAQLQDIIHRLLASQ